VHNSSVSILLLTHSLLLQIDGIIALLDEPQPELKVYALEQLNSLVDEFWAEISDSIAKM
jgi:26S proteasome regulatory subunit N2